MKFKAEYTATRDNAATIAVNASRTPGVEIVRVDPLPDTSKVNVYFEAIDHYHARTLALAMAVQATGTLDVTARIRTESWMFPGRWYDLNED